MKVLGATRFDDNTNNCYKILNGYSIYGGPVEPRIQMVQTLTHEMAVGYDMMKPLGNILTVVACLGFPRFL